MRDHPKFTVTEKAERAIRAGHPWVYGEEITAIDRPYENGAIVDVYSRKDRWLGAGMVSDHSKIRIRLLSRNTNDRFDEAFWTRRLTYALEYRRKVMPGDDFKCCRLIFGEADQFPGLTVDRFDDILVTQTLSYGMEIRKSFLFPKLVEILRSMDVRILAIYERNDVKIRELEGLSEYTGFFPQDEEPPNLNGHVVIRENDILYDVDFMNGQKTGFFLDQKYNRAAIAKLCPDMRVLDCFTHTGAFALNAANAGATRVTAVDISADAIAQSRANAKLNGLDDRIGFVCADVFEYLTVMAEKRKSEFDVIILDPPAFTKSRSTVRDAYRGYKEINLKAMKLLPRGGYLATCSCSHFMEDSLFRKMLADAASDAGVSLRQIEARTQSPDHPILWGVPETDYLKFYIFQVV